MSAAATKTMTANQIGNQEHALLCQRLQALSNDVAQDNRGAYSVEETAKQMVAISTAQEMLVQQGLAKADNTVTLLEAARLLDVLAYAFACVDSNRAAGVRRFRQAIIKQVEDLGGFVAGR